MRLPLLLHLRFPTEGGSYGLWLPWLLLYPILLAVMLIILPLVLVIAAILLPSGKAKPLILAGPYLWLLLASLGDLRVEIRTDHQEMLLNFI